MAQQNYFPKSSQVGQGGAQVLSGRASQVDMSGYVRGLENLATGIQQNVEYKRGIEALKQKEKNAQIASLNENITELQIPTFKKLAKQEFSNFWESVNKGEDWQPAFNAVMENISSLQAADNSMVKDRDKILEGEFRYEDGTRLQGGEVYSGLFEKDIPDDIMSIYKEGGVAAVVGSVLENTSTMSPNYYEKFKGGFDFNNEIGKYWATKLKNQGVESAKQIELGNDLTAAKVYRNLEKGDAIKAKSELIQDEAAKEFYFRNTALPYKTMNPEEKQKMWEGVVEQMIPPSTVDVTAIRNKPQEKGGLNFNFGGGRGENERFYFEKQTVEPNKTPEGEVAPISEFYERTPTDIISIEAKGTNPYQDFRTGEGQEVMRAALVSIKLDKNGEPVSLILTDEEEVPYKENAFILDQEYGLTKENIKVLYNQQQGNNQQEEVLDEEVDLGF